jgi:hypothetical protein
MSRLQRPRAVVRELIAQQRAGYKFKAVPSRTQVVVYFNSLVNYFCSQTGAPANIKL